MKLRTAALGLLAITACMPPIRVTSAFSSRFGDNDRARLTTVLSRTAPSVAQPAPTNSTRQPILAAVVQGEQRAVAVYDVNTHRALWTQAMPASSTPEILGDAIVVETGHTTRILDLATGRERAQVEHTGLEFAGAAREGDTIVITASAGLGGGGRRSGRVVAVDATSGRERWQHEISGLLGRPAVRGGVAYVPWERQSIAILDLATGVEQARLRSTDDVLSWVFASQDGVFYGGRGIYRLTPESASGTREGSAFLANPVQGVPGDPSVYQDGFVASTGTRTARDKIRFAFRPRAATERTVSLQDDSIYLAYYRDLVAVEAATGAVRWAVALEDDIESLTVTATGVFAVAGNGKIRSVDPRTGAVALVAELGAQIGAISTDFEGLALGANPTALEGDVRQQLVSLVRDPDNRLVPFRVFLVGLLAHRPEEEATRDLLDLYTQRSIPGQLRESIAQALPTRRNGAQFLVAALQDHYDYLEGRQSPPLQVIAPTLVAMNAREAVPGLLSHLLDHETPLAALPDVVSAVSTLGEASVVATLQRWIQLYRSDSTFAGPEHAVALNAATDAIFRHGDAAAREWLTHLKNDTAANALVRTHIEELFTRETAAAQTQATAASDAERQAALQTELNHLHELQQSVPGQLSDETIDEVWNANIDEIRACAQGAVTRNPNLNQIRVVVTLRGELPPALLVGTAPAQSGGDSPTNPRHASTIDEQTAWVHAQTEGITAQRSHVRLTTYAPNDPQLRACMDHVIQPLEFAAFRSVRQEFRRVIDTRAARPAGGTDDINGIGLDTQGRELPWWLVSAPTLEVENPRPATPARPGTNTATGNRPAGTPPAGTPPNGNTPAGNTPAGNTPAGNRPNGGTPDAGAPATNNPAGTPPARPWWEEQ